MGCQSSGQPDLLGRKKCTNGEQVGVGSTVVEYAPLGVNTTVGVNCHGNTFMRYRANTTHVSGVGHKKWCYEALLCSILALERAKMRPRGAC